MSLERADMELPTVKIPAKNAKGYKIINADDTRAKQAKPAPKPKKGKANV